MPPPQQWPSLVPGGDSVTWRRASDARMFIAAGYALVLQVSHPTVGAGVSEHSRFRSDPWGRLLRTLDYTYTMVYGGPQAAGEMGRRIRSTHRRICGVMADGRRYHALEPAAYAWVHATLAGAIVGAHKRFGQPLDENEREEFWAQWRMLGRLLGVRAGDLPAGWSAFEDYFQQVLEHTLARTAAVDEVLDTLGCPRAPGLPLGLQRLWPLARLPLAHVLGLGTIGLLGADLRARLGLGWSAAQELQLRSLGIALRASTPLMPGWLQNTGPGYMRQRQRALARERRTPPRVVT